MFRDPKFEEGVLVLDVNSTVYAPRRAEPRDRRMLEAGYMPRDLRYQDEYSVSECEEEIIEAP
jgi:hypothetical protein